MPKYIKLFESFIGEAAGDLMTSFSDTAKVKWVAYKQTFKLCTKKLGKMMVVTDANSVKELGFNLVVMLTSPDTAVINALKSAGGIAATQQTGTLDGLPGGESNYSYSARYLFKVTEADGTNKIDTVSNLMDGINVAGSAGTSGSAGLSAFDKFFTSGSEAGFNAAMQKAGISQVAAYLRLINNPALQAAAGQDASIKTLLDAQASALTVNDKNAKEKEIEPKVKTALAALLSQAKLDYDSSSDPNAKKAAQAKASQINSLISQYKPEYGTALATGSAGSAGASGTVTKR